MKLMYDLFVEGVPKAQPRPRMMKNGHVYNPDTADEWKAEIKGAFLASGIMETITKPVDLQVRFLMPVPKGMKLKKDDGRYTPHIKKPDADNLLKAVMDSITEVNVWKDDSLVYHSEVTKWYAPNKCGAEIKINVWS